MHVALIPFLPAEPLHGGEHPVHHPLGLSRDPRGEEEPLGQPLAMSLHEGRGDFFGCEGRALDLPPAKGRTVAAAQGAGVRLHHAHDVGGTPARKIDLPNPHRGPGRGDAAGKPVLTVPRGGFGQNRQALPAVHGDHIQYIC